MFLFAAMLLCSSTLKAQSEEEGLSWAVETGIGSEWELGGRAQYSINKYLALEGVVKYALDYNSGGNEELSIAQRQGREYSSPLHGSSFGSSYVESECGEDGGNRSERNVDDDAPFVLLFRCHVR